MKIAGMVVLAALTGWFVRGIRFEDPAPPAPVRAAVPQVEERSEAVLFAPPGVVTPAALHETSLGSRNLFAYREEPRVVVQPAVAVAAPVPVVAEPRPAVVEVTAPAPVFPWRYIGTFGPAHDRLAAFKGDGDIRTVRVGDRVGEFVLRSIGIESVEVEGPDGPRRVPLSSDV